MGEGHPFFMMFGSRCTRARRPPMEYSLKFEGVIINKLQQGSSILGSTWIRTEGDDSILAIINIVE
jgi:hypothetical protein